MVLFSMPIRRFEGPERLEKEMIEFYQGQEIYALPQVEGNAELIGELRQYLGAYVLFYNGSFGLYEPIAKANEKEFKLPIYVGKAVPTGDRTGIKAITIVQENSLYRRLYEHLRSVRHAENLDEADFYFKVIPTNLHAAAWVESVLIGHFRPAWNTRISGFGIHDPGKGRYNQKRSVWDQIHPGRPWAQRMANLAAYDLEEIKRKLS